MVNEVGKEITIHRHQLSFYSATVNEFHITAPPMPRGSGRLIRLISEPRGVVLIVRNVEVKARFAEQTCDL